MSLLMRDSHPAPNGGSIAAISAFIGSRHACS
jgi:formiminotetrahydrofolate cyclodeaminase